MEKSGIRHDGKKAVLSNDRRTHVVLPPSPSAISCSSYSDEYLIVIATESHLTPSHGRDQGWHEIFNEDILKIFRPRKGIRLTSDMGFSLRLEQVVKKGIQYW